VVASLKPFPIGGPGSWPGQSPSWGPRWLSPNPTSLPRSNNPVWRETWPGLAVIGDFVVAVARAFKRFEGDAIRSAGRGPGIGSGNAPRFCARRNTVPGSTIGRRSKVGGVNGHACRSCCASGSGPVGATRIRSEAPLPSEPLPLRLGQPAGGFKPGRRAGGGAQRPPPARRHRSSAPPGLNAVDARGQHAVSGADEAWPGPFPCLISAPAARQLGSSQALKQGADAGFGVEQGGGAPPRYNR